MKKFLLIALCTLFAALPTAGIRAISYQPADYALSNRQLNNPYRGWYHIYGYTLSDSAPINPQDIEDIAKKDVNQLALLEINLHNYADCEISPLGLAQLDSALLAWQNAGKQLILRFLYDWKGKARESEPQNISTIKRHMEQTGEIVNKYTGCVYIIQGIYVGNCGEMNNSDYMSLENMNELAAYLDSVIAPSIYLSVRTPEQYRVVSQSRQALADADAFSGKIAARTGLFNDGMLGSGNDLGTYGDKSLAYSDDFTGKGTRSEEIAFQNKLCHYVPNGGEVVLDNEYNHFPQAVSDLNAMHVSYLDGDYDRAVLDKWRACVYSANDPADADGVFDGTDGFSYIGAHLGYRYAIRSSACGFDTFWDDKATLAVTMGNDGFSSSYRPFVSAITVVREDGGICDTIIADADNRYWKSKEDTTWEVPLDVCSYGNGKYQIYYRLYDPATHREIRLANKTTHTNYGYLLGSVTIER